MAGTTSQTGARGTGAPSHRLRRGLIGLLSVALAFTPVAATLTLGGQEASAAPGDPGEPVVIGVTGDFGWNHPSFLGQLGSFMQGLGPDYVVTTGDNVQTVIPADGTDKYDFTVGRAFCQFLTGVVAGPNCLSGGDSPQNRFFPAPGNHDHMEGNGGGPIQNYTNYFQLPGTGVTTLGTSASELYYDVVMGPVHVFVIDSDPILLEQEHDMVDIPGYEGVSPTAVQQAWLQAAVAASTAPWKVVALHHSPYSSAPVETGAGYGSAAFVQWDFDEWGVDAVLSGHHHAYERVQRDGVQFVTNGLGGDDAPKSFGTPVDGSVVRFNEPTTVLGRLTATNDTLTYEAHSYEGDVVDRFTLGEDAPIAVASAAPTSGTAPLNVQLDASGSSDPGGGALTYAWDTDGDGDFDDETGVAPAVTYAASGTYVARVRVTNEDGITALSNGVTINVTATTVPQNITPPTVTGSTVVGSALTATPGTWSGATGTPSLQWQRCEPGTYPNAVAANSPNLHWRLGEATGTSAVDASPNGRNGEYLNGVQLGRPGALSGDTAVAFDGADDRVQIAGLSGVGTTAISTDMWVKTTDAKNSGLLSYAVEGSADEFHLLNPKALTLSVYGTRVDTFVGIDDGEWHHVAATWRSEGGEVRLYVDGSLRFSTSDVRPGVSLDGGGTLVLGQDQDSVGGGYDAAQAFVGELDEVALYPTALSAADVAAHHDAATGITCTDIAGATGTTYTLTGDDVGQRVRVSETASNALGSSAAHSATSAEVTSVPAPVNPFGTLDASKGPLAGQIRVTGWVADPSAPTVVIPARVTIGGPIGAPGTTVHNISANRSRPEVESAHPGYGTQHGFDATITTAKRGNVLVCVYAVNIGAGSDQLLRCYPVRVNNPNPVGTFEAVSSPRSGQISVRGWALDQSSPTSPVAVQVVIGGARGARGTESHTAWAVRRRDDVARAWPGTGNNHGLDSLVATKMTGEQTVCVYAKNTGLGTDTLLGCKKVDIVK